MTLSSGTVFAMGWIELAWEWVGQKDHLDDIIVGLLVAVLIGLFLYLGKKAGLGFGYLLREGRRVARLPKELEAYRGELDADTFRIRHSWMKEDQYLDDILIPVYVLGPSNEGVPEFADEWRRFLSDSAAAQHLVVTGSPGSGKSVTLRVAARLSWDVQVAAVEQSYVPVLMTFAQLGQSEFDAMAAITRSLSRCGLGRDHDQGDAFRQQCAREWAAAGRLLVLFDGLDELSSHDRKRAVDAVIGFAREFPKARLVVSCRSTPYREHKDAISRLQPLELEMAPLVPVAVRRFVRKWKFEGVKSANELITILSSRTHLFEMAQNPLMLTIITFLYSKPKYRLPDNRAEFYEVCARALLEEWDHSQASGRANLFDRPHKEELLARLAHQHLTGSAPDQDISETETYDRFSQWMGEMGFAPNKNVAALNEIVDNSGLLQRLPPNGLRFPHQTFLEYFAARHLRKHASAKELIEIHRQDPKRFREVLLLYAGLSEDPHAVDPLAQYALEADDVELAVEILCNARHISPDSSQQILERAQQSVSRAPTRSMVENLGYLARNELLAHAETAYAILKQALESGSWLSDEVLSEVVLAVARAGREQGVELIIEHFDRLALDRVLPQMGEAALTLASQVLRFDTLSQSKLRQWISSLERAGMVNLLYESAISATRPEIQSLAWRTLGSLSRTPEFWAWLDDPTTPEPPSDEEASRVMRKWGWPHPAPKTERGRAILVRIAVEFGQTMDSLNKFRAKKEKLNAWVSYLAHGYAWEQFSLWRTAGTEYNKYWQHNFSNHYPMLVQGIWRSSVKGRRLADWMSTTAGTAFGVMILATGPVLFFWGLSSFLWRLFGNDALGLDLKWTVGIISVHLLSGVASLIVLDRKNRVFRDVAFIFAALVGVLGFVAAAHSNSRDVLWVYCFLSPIVIIAYLAILITAVLYITNAIFLLLIAAYAFSNALLMFSFGGWTPFLPHLGDTLRKQLPDSLEKS